MKNSFIESYTKYISQKKINSNLKRKLSRTNQHRTIAWNEFNKLTIIIPFKLWQKYNYFKRYLIKPIFLFPFKLAIIITYTITISIFYLTHKLIYFLTYPFSKALNIPYSKTKIDGVSFIIPTWNKAEMVTTCVKKLAYILEKEKPELQKEIIVVNNGSIDNTVKSIESIISSIPISLINFHDNLGFAPAINAGCHNAKYNYVYLMNNDMIPKPRFFSSIINFAKTQIKQKHKFFGIASQIFFFDKNKRREESGKTYIYPYFGIIRAAHIVNHQNLQLPSFTCYPGGGSSLLNKHLFQKLNGYDFKTYRPMYCEDLDLGYLAWRLGYPSYFMPQSHVIHHHRSSSKKIGTDPSHYLFKNLLAFAIKNSSSFSLFLSHILTFPLFALKDKNHLIYMLEILPILPSILVSKILLLKYKTKISDSDLFDFINYELKKCQNF